jgi:hypothetical protein
MRVFLQHQVDGRGAPARHRDDGLRHAAHGAPVQGVGHHEGHRDGRYPEHDRAQRLADQHALRAEARAVGDEGNGAEGRPAPVQHRREPWTAEIVEGGIGDEQAAGEDHGAGDPAAEQMEQHGRDTLRREGERQQVLHEGQHTPGDGDGRHHEHQARP